MLITLDTLLELVTCSSSLFVLCPWHFQRTKQPIGSNLSIPNMESDLQKCSDPLAAVAEVGLPLAQGAS